MTSPASATANTCSTFVGLSSTAAAARPFRTASNAARASGVYASDGVAVMAVGGVALAPAGERRELARRSPGHAPHADADAVELGARHRHPARGLRQGSRQSPVGVGGEEEDRLEAGPGGPEQREPVRLGRGMG